MLTSTWWSGVAFVAGLLTIVAMLLARHAARSMAAARHGLRPTPAGAGLMTAEPGHLGRRCATVLASGAAALLATGAAATVAAMAAPVPVAVPVVVGLTAAGTVLTVLAPSRARGGGWMRDGALLLEWWRWPTAAKRRVAVDVLEELARQGRRPRDWPETWVRLATGAPGGRRNGHGTIRRNGHGRPDVRGCWYGYLWAMDSGAAGVARALLERALRDGPGGAGRHPRLLAECAFHVAWVWRDAAHAETLLTLLPTHPATRLDRLRARAAIHLARDEAERAAEACRTWLEADARAGQDRRPVVAAVMREWVQTLQDEAETTARATAPQAC